MALPSLPAQGTNPWYVPRTAWDTAVKTELEGRLSRDSLDKVYATTINARDPQFGIAGDGSTDDTVAIQSLFNSVNAGDVIRFPKGVYRHSGVSLVGKTRFVIEGEGAVFEGTNSSLGTQFISFQNCSDFTVRGLTSRASYVVTTSGPRGFSVNSCTRFAFLACAAENTPGPSILVFGASTEGRIENCMFRDSFKDGIHITGASKRISIVGNTIFNSGDDSIAVVSYQSDGAPCEDIAITGNTTRVSKSRGIVTVGGVNVAISGNVISSPQNAGIYVAYEASYSTYGVRGVTITGNAINQPDTDPAILYAGIHVIGGSTTYQVSEITVVGNTIMAPTTRGILIGSSAVGVYNVVCSDNNVRGSGVSGLVIQAVTNAVVTNNLIAQSQKEGISCLDTRGIMSVTGNMVIDPSRDTTPTTRRGIAILCPNITRGTISGNSVYDSTGSTTAELDCATSVNLSVYGNNLSGNLAGVPISSSVPFNVASSLLVAGAQPSNALGGGVGVLAVRNAATVPASNPSSGGVIYVESGALKYRGSSGTVTTLGPA